MPVTFPTIAKTTCGPQKPPRNIVITIQNNYFKFEEDALLLPQLLYIFLFLVIQTVIHSPTFGLHRKSEGRRNARGKKAPQRRHLVGALRNFSRLGSETAAGSCVHRNIPQGTQPFITTTSAVATVNFFQLQLSTPLNNLSSLQHVGGWVERD